MLRKSSRFFLFLIVFLVIGVQGWVLNVGAASAAPAVKEIPRFQVRVQVRDIDGKVPANGDKFTFALGSRTEPQSSQFTGENFSDWLSPTPAGLESILKLPFNVANRYWQVKMHFLLRGPSLPAPGGHVRLKVETAIENGENNSTEADLFGKVLGIVLWKGADGKIHIDTLAGHGRREYEPVMKGTFLPASERPRLIAFGDAYVAGDSDWHSWNEGIARLSALGINALAIPTSVQGETVDLSASARKAGIHRVWGGSYHAAAQVYRFSPERQRLIEEHILPPKLQPLLKFGWKPEEIAFWVIADEPGWHFPDILQMYNGVGPSSQKYQNHLVPHALNAFHEYLRTQGLQPRDVGHNSWGEVRLTGRDEYKDLPSRRLYYWSTRFIPWTFSRYFGEVTKTYQDNTRADLPVLVNLNNFIGNHYTPNMGKPGAASGSFDWLELSRENGVNAIGTEDWFDDSGASQWSFYATKLRSASDLNQSGFGGLIVPRVAGQRPGGLPQKILSLVGHGAKTVEFFVFGPEYNFPVNCYSENSKVFKPLSDGMRLVAKSEDLIYPGKQRTSEVAILAPQSSPIWDADGEPKPAVLSDGTNTNLFRARMAYASETAGLFMALQHAAVPAQFVDESGLNQADLRKFKVLYLTAPDLPAEALDAVLQWVREGGTLVTVAGTGQFDRYHQPQNALLEASGIMTTPLSMPLANRNLLVANGNLKIGELQLATYGDRETMRVTTAKVLGVFEDGKPALVEAKWGRGRIVHYGLYPGIAYVQTGSRNTQGLLTGFSSGWRDLLLGPVLDANVKLPVRVSEPLVEAPALYSEKGVAVTLLNWSGEEKPVRVTVEAAKPASRVESALHGKLDFQQQNGRVSAQLKVGDVDVLKIYY